jgi:arylsulfatase
VAALAAAGSALVLLGGSRASGPEDSKPSRPPNILLILADDLGTGEVGCYGQKIIRTPSIDRVAASGVRFTNAYSGSPVCAPSRACLLTGLHTGHAAIRDNKELEPEGQEPLPAEAVTLPKVLKSRGYATALIGKWGLGPPGSTGDPLKQGFDRFYGYNCQRLAHNHCPPWLYDNHEKIALTGNKPLAEYKNGLVAPDQTYAPDRFRVEAMSFIQAHKDGPWFLLFATPVPHAALQVPEDSLAEYRGKFDDPAYDGKRGYLPHPTPRAAYAGMVTRLDRDIGAILDSVRELGLEKDTLVIISSDNGPTFEGGTDSRFWGSAQGRRGLKGEVYEGGIRVPLIVRWPGRVQTGSVCAQPCAQWDLFPTLAAAAGLAPADMPAALDGLNLMSALTGAGFNREYLYWEYPSSGFQQAVRIGDCKCVRKDVRKNPDSHIEVYDLVSDPNETTDVAADHADVVRRATEIMLTRTPSQIAEWNY